MKSTLYMPCNEESTLRDRPDDVKERKRTRDLGFRNQSAVELLINFYPTLQGWIGKNGIENDDKK